MLAAGSSAISRVLRGPRQPATVLGVAAPALYLQAGPTVVAVVTSDAVRLPCAVVLPSSSAEFSLRTLPPDGVVTIGAGAVRWTSGGRQVVVDVVREWSPAAVRAVAPRADRLAELRDGLAAVDLEVDPMWPADRLARPRARAHAERRRRPGRCTSWVAARSACPCRRSAALHRTTALSAALLEFAAAGFAVPEVVAVIAGLAAPCSLGPAVDALLRVGHTSGAGLGAGVLRASARHAVVAA